MAKAKKSKPLRDRRAVRQSIDKILKRTSLLSMATANRDGSPHLNTAFFAYYNNDLFYLSDVRSMHCRNIGRDQRVAVTVFDSRQKWDADKSGVQLFGRSSVCPPKAQALARKIYAARFRDYADYIKDVGDKPDPHFKFFYIRIVRAILLDEAKLGEENFVKFKI